MKIIETNLSFAYDPGQRAATDYIILHHAAADGDVQAVHRYHRYTKGWSGIAYHFYVAKDGGVYRGRPEDWNGGHTGGYNHNSLGVCFEGNFETETMNDKQLTAGRALIEYLRERYPAAAIVLHGEVNATACPGMYFPKTELLAEDDDDDRDSPAAWAVESCEKAQKLDIVRGDGEGYYGWQKPVSLERLLVILDRAGALGE